MGRILMIEFWMRREPREGREGSSGISLDESQIWGVLCQWSPHVKGSRRGPLGQWHGFCEVWCAW